MRARGLATVLPLAAAFGACGGGGDGGDTKADATVIDGDSGTGGGGGSGGGGGGGGAGGGGGGERLRLSYIKETRPMAGGAGRVDLYLYDFQENEQFNLTAGEASGVVDCATKSCKLSGDQRYVGWLKSEPGGGFALWVAEIDVARKQVRLDRQRKVNDNVQSFDFTGEHVAYLRGQAAGIGGSVDVVSEPIGGPTGACDPDPANNQGQANCQQLVGEIDANGGFRVTPFGSLIILLRTTLASMTVDFFNISSGANQSLHTFGSQEGTGSQFHGRLPVALSPDARYLAVVTQNDFIWRLHALEARPNPPDPPSIDLFEQKTHPEGDCNDPWPHETDGEVFFNRVLFNPRFSHNGDFIYFLATGDCSRRGPDRLNRDDYDVIRVGRDLGSPKNITNIPRASHWSNHDISDFDLTADAKILAFTASRPNDTTSRSVWLMRFDGDQASYDCTRGPVQQGIDGKNHCEFIFDDIADTAVIHRNVTFHVVRQ